MNRAIKKKPVVKQVLSVSERENLEEEKRDLEGSLKQAEGYGVGTPGAQIDVGAIKSQINRVDAAIHESTPGRLTGPQKDALQKEALALADKFLNGLPTKYEMDHPAKCPGAVRKHMSWLVKFEKTGMIDRYRNIQRLINPGQELSVEALRKEK